MKRGSLLVALVVLLFGCNSPEESGEGKDHVDFNLVWGGVYASKDQETGTFSVFRLIDFNRDAYHSALYSEDFDEIPTLEDVRELSPFIGHVPIDSRGLLTRPELQLIGALPVDEDFFGGYRVYLEQHGVPQSEIDALVAKLIQYAEEPPLRLRLRLEGDELMIEEN